MRQISIPDTPLKVSRIAYGCMNIGGGWNHDPVDENHIKLAERIVHEAVEQGINLFDHADIYTFGKAQKVFGEVLKRTPGLREQIILQTKCCIRFADPDQPFHCKRYDLSREHIIQSVEDFLSDAQTELLDVLLLHRQDALVEPEEVAAAFDALSSAGKVRCFGLSNHSASRTRLLSKYVRQPLVINQVQLSLNHLQLIEEETMVNHADAKPGGYSGVLDYCHEHGILVQAWSPLAQGKPLQDPGALRECILKIADTRGVSGEAVVLSWLLRHPVGIQPVVGTTNSERLKRCCEADEFEISREEWYALYEAARGGEVP